MLGNPKCNLKYILRIWGLEPLAFLLPPLLLKVVCKSMRSTSQDFIVVACLVGGVCAKEGVARRSTDIKTSVCFRVLVRIVIVCVLRGGPADLFL